MKRKITLLAVILITTILARSFLLPANKHKTKLVLYVVVDQLAANYIERFDSFIEGGFKKLKDNGAYFPNTFHEHADTSTCPGHAALSTGMYPSHSGIVQNWWNDRNTGKQIYCVDDPIYKSSPKQLLVSALPDWIKNDNHSSKVFSVSGKDRAAIMMGGKSADAAFWYDKKSGNFTTSKYYNLLKSPKWFEQFHKPKPINQFFGVAWESLPVDPLMLKKAEITILDRGLFPDNFPHSLGDASVVPDLSFYEEIYQTPFLDQYTIQFTKALIRGEELGQDSNLDYLSVSLSALDLVGHKYGPNSPEVLDAFRKVDLQIGELLDFIDQTIGLKNVLVVVSSDHGVQAFPEYQHHRGIDAFRRDTEDVLCIQNSAKKIEALLNVKDLFKANLYLNSETIAHNKIPLDKLEDLLKSEIQSCRSVKALISTKDLLEAENYLFKNSYHPERSPDYFIELERNALPSQISGTSHGTPYDYDSHVPAFFMGNNIEKGIYQQRIATVDLAPTVASILKLKFPTNLDGKLISAELISAN
ncbi:MAG: alkaline phosphatase family protein [Deltaproteobacteria bacterium]|nr:alkaline phosphatase family protein [Deltaproteobacteria bacterium]